MEEFTETLWGSEIFPSIINDQSKKGAVRSIMETVSEVCSEAKLVDKIIKAIHAKESEKAVAVVKELRSMKLKDAVKGQQKVHKHEVPGGSS